MSTTYDVCVFGLGPVGTITGVCIAKQGFNVIGIDINPQRVESFSRGEAPFEEPEVNDFLKEVVNEKRFTATLDAHNAVANSHIILIAVGTPTPEESGKPDLSQLDAVAKTIGEAIKNKDSETIVVVRSTVPPGTMRNRLAPIIAEHSGKEPGKGFHIASNPEFLREGKAIDDFFSTGRIVIGSDSDTVADTIERLYFQVDGKRIRTSVESAEFAKYVDNTWHAVKVSFANEVGRVCKAFGGNLEETTEIFLADNNLNLSGYYLKPGFAFGGSCLPKDVRGLRCLAEQHDVKLPLIDAILPSNEETIANGVKAIRANNPQKVAILGIAFKEHVDDLRESPALEIIRQLQQAGIKVEAHDFAYKSGDKVTLPRKGGELTLSTLDNTTDKAETLVLMHDLPEYRALTQSLAAIGLPVVDLTTIKLKKKKATTAPNVGSLFNGTQIKVETGKDSNANDHRREANL